MLFLLSQTLYLLGLATFAGNPGRASPSIHPVLSKMRRSGVFPDCSPATTVSDSIPGAAMSLQPSMDSGHSVYLSAPSRVLRILSKVPGIDADNDHFFAVPISIGCFSGSFIFDGKINTYIEYTPIARQRALQGYVTVISLRLCESKATGSGITLYSCPTWVTAEHGVRIIVSSRMATGSGVKINSSREATGSGVNINSRHLAMTVFPLGLTLNGVFHPHWAAVKSGLCTCACSAAALDGLFLLRVPTVDNGLCTYTCLVVALNSLSLLRVSAASVF
ncbi:hypothetical protein MVEN_02250900 [Mycena venus]|uniref:Uncharacterized protein n=1 Tax=Mycena venus TaxID=2733690 RepID=A0A8H7CGF0_9AGAR|nr:hypothetical protein MVEN_02250900 [Mycena venus]